MMKLKVVDNYTKAVMVEADTIDNLKARIMESFSLTEEDLSERLLVHDGRDIPYNLKFCLPMVDGFDLLGLEEGSILKDYGLKDDGDALLLGWKGPFIIRFVPAAVRLEIGLQKSVEIKIKNHDVTLGELKRKIERGTGKRITAEAENLPTILLEGDNEKPLLFFGFYKYYKGPRGPFEMVEFRISPNRDNDPQFGNLYEPAPVSFLRTIPWTPRYYGQRYDPVEEGNKFIVRRIDRDGKLELIPITELQNARKNKGTEGGDKENAGCSNPDLDKMVENMLSSRSLFLID